MTALLTKIDLGDLEDDIKTLEDDMKTMEDGRLKKVRYLLFQIRN